MTDLEGCQTNIGRRCDSSASRVVLPIRRNKRWKRWVGGGAVWTINGRWTGKCSSGGGPGRAR